MDIHISLAAQEVFRIGGLVVTNSMLTGIVASSLLAVIMILIGRSMSLSPKAGIRGVVDAVSDWLLSLIEEVTHDREKSIRFFPIVITIFFFVLINNWLGLFPGVGSIHVGDVPLFRGMTADLNATLALAAISVGMIHIYAVRELGIAAHARTYFHKDPILMFVGILEMLSDLSKAVSFAFRLFGNIFAGEVLLVVVAALAPLAAPLPFFLLEIFVGFVQALVFSLLTVVFFGIATAHQSAHDITEITA
jgi:F-type H+-transporting ATPase subunit a